MSTVLSIKTLSQQHLSLQERNENQNNVDKVPGKDQDDHLPLNH